MSVTGPTFYAANEERTLAARPTASTEMRSLKARDNTTNIYYLAKVYAIVAITLAATLWSFHEVTAHGLDWWWNIPAAAAAIVVIGASQHQLGGVVHEGTHYMLFADRRTSEIASDWLGAFPIYTSTYAFRLHHLAHHQFINDPERDPNFGLADEGGHWLDFPVAHVELLLAILRQLWPINLVRYIVARVKYSALGVDSNPYANPRQPGSPWIIRAGVVFAGVVPAAVVACILAHQWALAWAVLLGGWGAVTLFYIAAPETDFSASRIDPVISHRTTAISRVAYLGILYTALTAIAEATGAPAWGYFFLLWVVPLFTTFPLFMILREWLQHGNGDRGRYTNSRVFFVNPLVRYAVFPWGQDYHLPHHLVANVPHYKLKQLHKLLRRDPEYAAQGLEVEGWSHPNRKSGRPTIVDVLGPEYAPRRRAAAHIDPSVLEDASVNDVDGVNRHVAKSRLGR